MLWPEKEEWQHDDADSFVSDAKDDGASVTKIRWFVVIKSGHHACTCLLVTILSIDGCMLTNQVNLDPQRDGRLE